MGPIRLADPDRANLLAIILHDLLSRTSGRLPTGSIQFVAGRMKAHVTLTGEPVVRGGEGPADCTITAGLADLTNIMTGDSFIGPFLTGRIQVGGNPLKALGLLRCLK